MYSALSGSRASILSLLGSPPVSSYTIRLIFSHYQAYCMSTLARRLAVYLFSHSHSGSLPVYSHTIRLLPVYSHSHSGLLPVYSHTSRLTTYLFSHYQTHCHSFSLAGLLSIYSLTLTQARCLSILTLSGFCLSVLTPSGLLPVYSHTSRLTAYLFSHYQTHCHLFSLHQARCLSILALKLLSICFHTQCC